MFHDGFSFEITKKSLLRDMMSAIPETLLTYRRLSPANTVTQKHVSIYILPVLKNDW